MGKVLDWALKIKKEAEEQIKEDKKFQTVGAATLKYLPPIVESLYCGMARKSEFEDLKVQ